MEAEKSVQSDQTEQDSLNKQQTTITITYKRANPTSTSVYTCFAGILK